MKKFLLVSAAILALLFICGLAGSSWLANSTGKQLKKLRTEISDAGDPIYYTDYGTEPVPEQKNAFVLLSEAEAGIDAYSELVRSLEAENESTNSGIEQSKSPLRLKQQKTFFAENSELFDLLKRASQRQSFQTDIDRSQGFGASTAHAETSRRAIEMLADKASMLASNGEGDAAIEVCLTGYRILHLTEQEKFLVGFLIECVGLEELGKAVQQTLTTCEVSEPMLDALDTQLQQFNLNTNLTNTIKVERATGIQSFQEFHQASKSSDENQIPIPAFFAGTNIGKAYFNDDESAYIEYMNECISMVNQTKTLRDQRMDVLIKNLSASSYLKTVSKLITPDMTSIFDAKDDAIARVRALRISLALQRQPDLPVKSLPAEIREDPYTSTNMISSKTSDGWLIYSVGRNLKDDSGTLTPIAPSQRPLDVGYGPTSAKPTTSN
ncbi:MAG: hypothetical protein ACR2N1_16305 [Rubripirellula sp.]